MASLGVPQGFVTSGTLLPGHLRGCCGETFSVLYSCLHAFALQETTAPKALFLAASGSALVCQQLQCSNVGDIGSALP